jgi:hypothetical protein
MLDAHATRLLPSMKAWFIANTLEILSDRFVEQRRDRTAACLRMLAQRLKELSIHLRRELFGLCHA